MNQSNDIDFKCDESLKDINFYWHYNISFQWQIQYTYKKTFIQNHDWISQNILRITNKNVTFSKQTSTIKQIGQKNAS